MLPCDAVVLNWRDAQLTIACIESLLPEASLRRIWIVDNQSTGELRRELATRAGCDGRVAVIEHQRNLGFSGGVNIGLAAALEAGARTVFVINNDAVLCQDSLSLLLAGLEAEEGVAMVAPTIVDDSGRTIASGGAFRSSTLTTRAIAPVAPDYLTWAAVLVRASVLREAGLLSDRFFMYWEDVEFGLRLRDLGRRMEVVEEATVIHRSGSSHARAGERVVEYSAHGAVTLARMRPGLAIKAGAVFRVAKRLLGYALLGDSARARAVWRGAVTGLLYNGPATARYPRP